MARPFSFKSGSKDNLLFNEALSSNEAHLSDHNPEILQPKATPNTTKNYKTLLHVDDTNSKLTRAQANDENDNNEVQSKEDNEDSVCFENLYDKVDSNQNELFFRPPQSNIPGSPKRIEASAPLKDEVVKSHQSINKKLTQLSKDPANRKFTTLIETQNEQNGENASIGMSIEPSPSGVTRIFIDRFSNHTKAASIEHLNKNNELYSSKDWSNYYNDARNVAEPHHPANSRLRRDMQTISGARTNKGFSNDEAHQYWSHPQQFQTIQPHQVHFYNEREFNYENRTLNISQVKNKRIELIKQQEVGFQTPQAQPQPYQPAPPMNPPPALVTKQGFKDAFVQAPTPHISFASTINDKTCQFPTPQKAKPHLLSEFRYQDGQAQTVRFQHDDRVDYVNRNEIMASYVSSATQVDNEHIRNTPMCEPMQRQDISIQCVDNGDSESTVNKETESTKAFTFPSPPKEVLQPKRKPLCNTVTIIKDNEKNAHNLTIHCNPIDALKTPVSIHEEIVNEIDGNRYLAQRGDADNDEAIQRRARSTTIMQPDGLVYTKLETVNSKPVLRKYDESKFRIDPSKQTIILPLRQNDTYYNGEKLWVKPSEIVIIRTDKQNGNDEAIEMQQQNKTPTLSEIDINNNEHKNIKHDDDDEYNGEGYDAGNGDDKEALAAEKPLQSILKHKGAHSKKNKNMRATIQYHEPKESCSQKCCLAFMLIVILSIVLAILGYFIGWDLVRRKYL